jgi:hypothetical protein
LFIDEMGAPANIAEERLPAVVFRNKNLGRTVQVTGSRCGDAQGALGR